MVHPPPINYISATLLLAVFEKGFMLRMSQTINKIIFWLENIYYILVMLFREMVLGPFVFARTVFNILKAASIINAARLILIWIFTGPPFLVYCCLNDMYFFLKILCDYREDDDAREIKKEEDLLQDKIVIYNEVIDTLRAIMNTMKYQKRKLLKKWEKKGGQSPSKNAYGENPLLV